MLHDIAKAADQLDKEGIFLGCPKPRFARGGRNQLIVALDQGLTPDCYVLDIGCGCLRAGYWLIHFLEPGHYCGIEPNNEMLNAGREHLLESEIEDRKAPKFSCNDEFDFSVFDCEFDYFIARSVWSHATKKQIENMLDAFCETASNYGVFLVSFRLSQDGKDNDSKTWVGKSHVSRESGLVAYTFKWIEKICKCRGLAINKLYMEFGQLWVRIEREHVTKTRMREPKRGRVLGFTDN